MAPAASRRLVLLGVALAAVLLLLASPSPSACVQTLADAGSAPDQAAPLIAVLSLAAWLLAAWLLLVVVVTTGGHLPGAVGHGLSRLAGRVAPGTVRRTLEVALGLSVAVGLLGAPPAAAAPGPAGPAAGVDLDWGSAAPAAQDLDWAASAATPPAAPGPVPATAGPVVVVEPGDSLWALAEQDLAARGESTTDAAVARAWPTWWAANRDAVGDDPDLLQPGTRLAPPRGGSTPPASS